MAQNFLIGVSTLSGWQIGYVTNTDREVLEQDRSLTTDQYRAAKEGIEFLESNPAAVQVNCDEIGVRITRA